MKKLLSVTLIFALALAMTACCCIAPFESDVADTPVYVAPEPDNSEIVEYVEANKDTLLASMESSFAGSSGMTCTSDVRVEGMGFVFTININELDNVDDTTKGLMQEAYDSMSSTFESALSTFQLVLPDLEYYEVQVCEVDGDLIATIIAGEK